MSHVEPRRVLRGSEDSAMTIPLMVLVIGCIAWGVVALILMIRHIESRGVKINWIWLRALTPRYVDQYRKLTRQETGKVGPLFYHFIAGFGSALIFALLLIINNAGMLK